MSSEPMIATDVGQHVAPAHVIGGLEKGEARRPDLAAIGPVGAVRDEIDAELALRRLDRRVGLARRHVIAFGVELEVMDQRFHRLLHLGALGRRDFDLSTFTGPDGIFSRHCLMILIDWRISSMRHEIAVPAIAVAAHRNVEIHIGIGLVGLRTCANPTARRSPQHRPRYAPIERLSLAT